MESHASDYSTTLTDQDKQEGYLAPMLPTFSFMDSATAVNELMQPVSTCPPQMSTRRPIVNSVLHIEGDTTEATDNNEIGTMCGYTIIQVVQEGHTYHQSDSE